VLAQSSLGIRFQNGFHVDEDCNSSFLYYEAAGRMSIEYILRTYALDTSEREKLTLMGPYALEKGLQVDKKLSLEKFSSDVLDLLEEQGAYGNLDSLNYLGVQYLMGTPNIERNF